MSVLKIWDLHMTYDGPITDEFLQGTKQLAESIAEEPGIIWKIWTAEEGTNHYGSTYLFRTRDDLETYKAMHMKRLEGIGIKVTSDHVFDIMEEVSAINNAPLGG
ncbi:monooxygenase [Aliiroseovarius crassostreae]|uniref:monooxygenase n=1 Tax=Aliiroseovarius crassostreae TaxID=154981 RepID=UPI00220DD7E1|nr:monooxygenase [Aliiroseovarius crassostreae]UWQ07718.1 monooxygenase [Aliiroseovarius crassostreae]